MPIDYVALRAELNNDPQGYGYAPFLASGADNVLARLLDFLRDGVTAAENGVVGPAVTGIRRIDISADDVLEAIDSRDLQASTSTTAGGYMAALLARPRLQLIDEQGANTRVRANLNRLLADTNGSQTRVSALMTRNGSRAEQLFGSGVVVTDGDIAIALAPQRAV